MSKRKIFWSILGVIVLVAVGIQLIPYGRNYTNPPVLTAPQWDSPRTSELFARLRRLSQQRNRLAVVQ